MQKTCNHYEQQFRFICARREPQPVDLTRYFDRAEVESEYDGFRADVLLTSAMRRKVLFVEFAVTHFCEPEKVSRGHRIVEIVIKDEAGARALAGKKISDEDMDLRVHNLHVPNASGDFCGGACGRSLSIFRVYASGKAVLLEKKPQEYRGLHRKSLIHERVIPPPGRAGHGRDASDTGEGYEDDASALFKTLVREAANTGVPVRNCFLCRYHGADGINAAVYCKLFKEPTSSNSAGECGHYFPVASAELAEIDRKNAEYQQRIFINRVVGIMSRGRFGNLLAGC